MAATGALRTPRARTASTVGRLASEAVYGGLYNIMIILV
jgi:hypothetical protein